MYNESGALQHKDFNNYTWVANVYIVCYAISFRRQVDVDGFLTDTCLLSPLFTVSHYLIDKSFLG